MNRAGVALLLLLSGAVAFAFQGTRGLYEPTEGRYAEAAREMLVSGDYLEPTLAGRPHWTKPPLAYWTTAAGMRVFGRTTRGARLANAFLFMATTLAVAAMGRLLWDGTTGVAAGLVYLSSLLPAGAANVVSADTLLCFFLAAAVLAYLAARRAPGGAARWATRAMWIAFGFAFATKGPPALLPLVALAVFHARSGEGQRGGARLADALGIVLFAVTALWWYALESWRHPELLRYFLLDEIVGRNVSGEFHRNGQWYGAFAVYLPTLLLGMGAWIVPAVRVAARERLNRWQGWRSLWEARGTPRALLALWFTLPLVAFALARSRLPLYLLPLFAPLALVVAREMVRSAGSWRRTAQVAAVSAVVIVAAKAYAPRVSTSADMEFLYHSVMVNAALVGDTPRVRIITVMEEKLYGLEFYTDGRIERVSLWGDPPWAVESFDSALDALCLEPEGLSTWVFVIAPRYADAAMERMHSAGLRTLSIGASGWTLITASGAAPVP